MELLYDSRDKYAGDLEDIEVHEIINYIFFN